MSINNKLFEALERLKTAPNFMGGTVEYKFNTNSQAPLLEDYELIKQFLKVVSEHLKFEDGGTAKIKDFITGKEETKHIIKVRSEDTYATTTILLDTEEHYTFKDMLKGANNEI